MTISRRSFLAGAAAGAVVVGTGRWAPAAAAIRGIDHVVIMLRELEPGIQSYRELGFAVMPGGVHPVGTHNALIALADGAYIELIAFRTPNDKHRWWNAMQKGGGLIDFCMQTDDLAGDIAAFRQAGVKMSDPVAGGRLRPDGYKLAWVTASAPPPFLFQAPFLIQDHTPREERIGRETTHANGVTGIAAITVATDDVARVRSWWSPVLRQAGQDVQRPDVDGAGVRFTAGPHLLDFVAPKSAGSPLRAWIGERGPSPYSLTLATTTAKATRLDDAKTGTRILLQ
ncbi:MAG: VOC family protein [Candidatus Rokubacteria bacterium]|nr:VOC family protein [Candidatus Rokubacteria bacterium]